MNVQGPIKQLIADNAAANAALGGRVYAVLAPQEAGYPLAVITAIGNRPHPTKSPLNNLIAPTSLVDNVSVQVDVYSTKFNEVADVAEKIRLAIDGYRGDVTHLTMTVAIDGLRYDNTVQDMLEEPELFRQIDQYTVRVNRVASIGAGNVPVFLNELDYYASDAAAITAGLSEGDWYLTSDANIYGMPTGMPKKIQEQ